MLATPPIRIPSKWDNLVDICQGCIDQLGSHHFPDYSLLTLDRRDWQQLPPFESSLSFCIFGHGLPVKGDHLRQP